MTATKTATKTKTATVKAFQLLSVAETGKLIDGIVKAGKKLDNDIQLALQCCSIHAHMHGDITLLQRIVSELHKGARMNAVKGWMEQYSPIKWAQDGKTFEIWRGYDVKNETARAEAIARIEKAEHWTEFKPEQPFQPFDLQAQLLSLLSKAKKAAASPEAEQHKIDAGLLAKLTALAPQD